MKMLGKVKKFARCNLKGHGHSCPITQEIQSTPIFKAEDRRLAKNEIQLGIAMFNSERFDKF